MFPKLLDASSRLESFSPNPAELTTENTETTEDELYHFMWLKRFVRVQTITGAFPVIL
jgi:hypothetical protein